MLDEIDGFRKDNHTNIFINSNYIIGPEHFLLKHQLHYMVIFHSNESSDH